MPTRIGFLPVLRSKDCVRTLREEMTWHFLCGHWSRILRLSTGCYDNTWPHGFQSWPSLIRVSFITMLSRVLVNTTKENLARHL